MTGPDHAAGLGRRSPRPPQRRRRGRRGRRSPRSPPARRGWRRTSAATALPGDADRRAGPARRRGAAPRCCPSSATPCPRSPAARRTYVAPRRRLQRAPAATRVPRAAPRRRPGPDRRRSRSPIVADGVRVRAAARSSSARTWTEVALMLAGAAPVRAGAGRSRARRARPRALRGAVVLGALRAARGLHGALDHLVADARATRGWRPTARSPTSRRSPAGSRSGGSRPAAGAPLLVRRSRSARSRSSGWSLLTKVFPARARGRRDVRAPAAAVRTTGTASGSTAALGIPPLLWLAARRSGHAAVNALAWPGLGLRDRLPAALLLARRAARGRRSGSRSGSRSCRCGCARVVALGGVLVDDAAARRVGLRAGRADRATARRWRCASTPARRFGALLLLLFVGADRRRPRRRLPLRRPPARARDARRARAAR